MPHKLRIKTIVFIALLTMVMVAPMIHAGEWEGNFYGQEQYEILQELSNQLAKIEAQTSRNDETVRLCREIIQRLDHLSSEISDLAGKEGRETYRRRTSSADKRFDPFNRDDGG